jgi:hypothetical protein
LPFMSHIPVAVLSSCFSFAELNSNSYLKFPVHLVAASIECLQICVICPTLVSG